MTKKEMKKLEAYKKAVQKAFEIACDLYADQEHLPDYEIAQEVNRRIHCAMFEAREALYHALRHIEALKELDPKNVR